jgi:hypothetical protein
MSQFDRVISWGLQCKLTYFLASIEGHFEGSGTHQEWITEAAELRQAVYDLPKMETNHSTSTK